MATRRMVFGKVTDLYRQGYDEPDLEVQVWLRVPQAEIGDGGIYNVVRYMLRPEWQENVIDAELTGEGVVDE